MNLAALALAPAAMAGLAAIWFLLDWMRAVSAALPGLQPVGPAALPWLLLCVAAGAALGGRMASRAGRAGRSPLVAALRWLAAAGAAVIGATWSLQAVLPPGGEAVLAGGLRLAAAILPAAPAAILLGGACVQLAAVRCVHGAGPARAIGGVIAAAAAGAFAGAWLYREQLLDGTALMFASSACWLGAAVVCGLLTVFEPPTVARAPHDTRVSNGGMPALLTSAFGAAAAPSLLRVALQARGHELGTLVAVVSAAAAGLCVGAALTVPLAPSEPHARARSLRGTPPLALALALLVLLLGWISPLLGAALLGACVGAALVAAAGATRATGATASTGVEGPAGDDPRVCARALACVAAGLACGLFAQDALRRVGWSGGELLRAVALAAAIASIVCALLRGAWLRRGLAMLPGVLLLVVVWSVPAPALPWSAAPDEVALIQRLDDPLGTLTLVATAEGGTRRRLDGWPLPSGPTGALAERRMARLSAAMQPDAQSALLIGAGDGQLLAGLSELLPGRVECIEPLGSLVEQARATPAPEGLQVVLPEHADPRAAVASRTAAWDLVVIGPQPPGRLGQGELYSLEHLLALRRALRPGGVAVQWLPLQQMPWPAFASASQSFLEAFPETRVFVGSLLAPEPCVALVGGLEHGLPGVERLDAFLGAAPSAAGLGGAADVFDLYVCDGWTLGGRVRESPLSSLARPLAELLSEGREDDAVPLSIMNLRLLADVSIPLDTVSLAARPVGEKDDKALGAELVARSRALRWLLIAQAARLERTAAPAGSLSSDERNALEDEQGAALLAAWNAAPGHADAARGLLAFASELVDARRWPVVDSLLAAAAAVHADGRLLGLRAGVLIELGAVDEAVRVGRQATAASPHDPNGLVNLARALLITAQDDEAHTVLVAAREAFAPTPLPPLHAACLALLEHAPDARATANALLEKIPAGESWAAVLRRLLGP